jgi:hypothetical protein
MRLNASLSNPLWVFLGLSALMAATRWPFGVGDWLPDASWAVFFLAGFWHLRAKHFLVLCALAWLIDFFAVSGAGVPNYCMTPAYFGLWPAYACLMAAGRLCTFSLVQFKQISGLFFALFCGVLGCFVLSNLAFYLFSGYFQEMSWQNYVRSVSGYFIGYWATSALYVFLAISSVCLGQLMVKKRQIQISG